jgi:hypothetical protein
VEDATPPNDGKMHTYYACTTNGDQNPPPSCDKGTECPACMLSSNTGGGTNAASCKTLKMKCKKLQNDEDELECVGGECKFEG